MDTILVLDRTYPSSSQSVVPSAEGRKNTRTRWRPPNLTSHIVREQLIIETPQLLVMWIASMHNLWVKPHLTESRDIYLVITGWGEGQRAT